MLKDGVRKWYIGAVSGWLRGGARACVYVRVLRACAVLGEG